jgi:hypothetical protein
MGNRTNPSNYQSAPMGILSRAILWLSTPQTLLEGCCAAEFLSKHSEQMPDCFFHKPLKKCLRHKILRHCLQGAPLNSPKVRLQIPQVIGAIENAI